MSEPTEGQARAERAAATTGAPADPSTAGAGSPATASRSTPSDSSQPSTAGTSTATAVSPASSTSGASGSGAPSGTSGDGRSSTPTQDVGPSEAVLGPFTTRELVFGGGVLLVFLGTLLPFVGGHVLYTTFWSSASLFFIGIGILLPVIALALLAGRRLGSAGLRVGSLSVDQFASVTAVLAATFFFLQTVTAFQVGPLLALVGSLGLLAATVAGPFLPVVKNDFVDRSEVPAHVLARPITAAKPRAPKPAKPAKPAASAAEPTDNGARAGVGGTPSRMFGGRSSAPSTDSSSFATGTGASGATGAGMSGAAGAGAVSSHGTSASGEKAVGSEPRDAQVGASGNPAPQRTTGRDALVPDTAADPAAGDVSQDVTNSGRSGSAGHGDTDTDTRMFGAAPDATREQDPVADDGAPVQGSGDRNRQEPITATRSADEESVVEAFWFAVGSPRPVFDENTGREIFVLQPGDWEVGIEDRGREFLVQDKRSGAVGILRDLRNIERAPRD